MSVSRKVLRRMKKVMGLIGTSAVLAPCSSQVSCAMRTWCHRNVQYRFDGEHLLIRGNGTIERNSIKGNLTKEEMENISKIHIGGGITEIDECAFKGFSKLRYIRIPNSVGYIAQHAFSDCKSLEKVTIPNSVEFIACHAFSGCTSLREVTISNSARYIYAHAFYGCESLEKITIPNSVDFIGHYAFYGCKNLTTVEFSAGDEQALCALDSCYKQEMKEYKEKKRDKRVLSLVPETFWDNFKSDILAKFLFFERLPNVVFGERVFGNCKRLCRIDTNGRTLTCGKNMFEGVPFFQNFRGKVMRGKYYYPCHQDIMAQMFLLDSINNSFNKNGEEENPVNCPCRYSFSHSDYY